MLDIGNTDTTNKTLASTDIDNTDAINTDIINTDTTNITPDEASAIDSIISISTAGYGLGIEGSVKVLRSSL